MLQGTADMLVPARHTERYVATIRSKLGDPTTDAFLRYYEVPGFQHGQSTVFQSAWASLTALASWVENVIRRIRNTAGTGDVNVAASFICFTN